VIATFTIGRLPEIVFGTGTRARIPELARTFGRRALLVTGARSLRASRHWNPFDDALAEAKLAWLPLIVEEEPSPEFVDEAVREHRGAKIDVVVAVGGGSVLDAAKAVAGLLPSGRSVMDHLEGVGRGVPFTGPTTPLIAAPTTAGSGSEATKNAVLSRRGGGGFKKSFRDEALIARYAVVDPDLLESCPRDLVAADGADALTQLLESYVSLRSNPFTDGLAESGLAAVRDGLRAWHRREGDTRQARARMAYAALASGITLAQAGLGAVHGLAAPLGALFPIPHGLACGTLLAAATETNLAALQARAPDSPAMPKYARAFEILSGERAPAAASRGATLLVELLHAWTTELDLAALGRYGIGEADLSDVVADCGGGSMKTNPIVLEDAELRKILIRRL